MTAPPPQHAMFESSLRSAQERAGYAYLRFWRPATLTALLVTMLLVTAIAPEATRADVLWICTGAVLSSWIASIAARLGGAPRLVAAALIASDITMIAVWSVHTQNTGEALAALTSAIIISAWLLGARGTLAIGMMCVAITLGIFTFGSPHGGDDEAVPNLVWVLLGVTGLAVAVATELERTFTAATSNLQSNATELRRIADMRRRLVADVSHELRTPLTAVNGFLDTLLRGDVDLDSQVRADLLAEARRGGARLEALVGDLLDFERTSRGMVELDLAPRPIGPLLEDAVRSVPKPPNRTVEIVYAEATAADLKVEADDRRLVQVIANIVVNALEHGTGTIRVHCCSEQGSVQIDISDLGPGLPHGAEVDAFEPFTSFGEHHGSPGLGLAIARAFTEAHGGTLTYVNDTGAGNHAFRVCLPHAIGA